VLYTLNSTANENLHQGIRLQELASKDPPPLSIFINRDRLKSSRFEDKIDGRKNAR